MNASPSPAPKFVPSRCLKIVLLAACLFVGGGIAVLAVQRNQSTSRAADRAARVAAGLRANERMAGGKDCPWDGRQPE